MATRPKLSEAEALEQYRVALENAKTNQKLHLSWQSSVTIPNPLHKAKRC
jgi:hypothetical protein